MGSQQWGILFAQIMERLPITIAMLIAALILGLIKLSVFPSYINV